MKCAVWFWWRHALADVEDVLEGGEAVGVCVFVYTVEEGGWGCDGDTQAVGGDFDAEV